MYVVLTLAELELYGSRIELGWDLELGFCPFPDDGPAAVLDAREVTLSEEQARRFGILAPRGERWLKSALDSGYFDGTVPEAKIPGMRAKEHVR